MFGLLVCVAPVRADDPPKYPKGYSRQKYDRRAFELIVPEVEPEERGYSLLLLVSVNGRDDLAQTFASMASEGFVVCAPKSRFLGIKGAGENWAANEGPELVDLTNHLVKALGIDPRRTHVLGYKDWAGFLPLVAFAKKARFRGVCFVESVYRGGSVPSRARKDMGVLVIGKGPMETVPADQRIVPYLSKKFRVAEYRHDEPVPSPYMRYWFGVMEGRFTPGHDLSLNWLDAGTDVEGFLAARVAGARPCLLYFFAPGDEAKPEAKDVQNEVFFDPKVREGATGVATYKLNRKTYDSVFKSLGLTETPAVVVLDKSGSAVARLEGGIRARKLARALRKVAK